MKILKIKQNKNGKCFYNYFDKAIHNAPTFIVKLSFKEINLLLEAIKQDEKEN